MALFLSIEALGLLVIDEQEKCRTSLMISLSSMMKQANRQNFLEL
jgi:hypothetical protein